MIPKLMSWGRLAWLNVWPQTIPINRESSFLRLSHLVDRPGASNNLM